MLTSPSGIAGLDAVLRGGFPLGRTTIVIGGPGSGKTVLGMQYLMNGAALFDEPSLMISVRGIAGRAARKLRQYVAGGQERRRRARAHHRRPHAGRRPGSGSIRLGRSTSRLRLPSRPSITSNVWRSTGSTRSSRSPTAVESPSRDLRILNWLAGIKLTTLLTMKRSNDETGASGYFELAEYAADGVIELQKTAFGELARRTLSVVKLRGAAFDAGSHSYTISDQGIRVLHSPARTHTMPQDLERRVSTGVERLDTMLLGGYRAGYQR